MAKAKAMPKRRTKAARKAKRKTVRGAGATEVQARAIPGPQGTPHEQEEAEWVEHPLEDWPEEADGGEDRWLNERKGEDEQRPAHD